MKRGHDIETINICQVRGGERTRYQNDRLDPCRVTAVHDIFPTIYAFCLGSMMKKRV